MTEQYESEILDGLYSLPNENVVTQLVTDQAGPFGFAKIHFTIKIIKAFKEFHIFTLKCQKLRRTT